MDRQGGAATVRLTADPGNRPAGEYHAVVTVTAPGATPQEVKVIARVMTSAAMGLSASEICFTPFQDGPDAHRDDVRITSVDGSPIGGLSAAITYEPGQPTGWLEASVTAPDAPSRLWLQSTKAGLPPGRYGANVVVSSTTPGIAPVSFHVTFNIQGGLPPSASRIEVTITWEGTQGAAIPTVSGSGGLHCGPSPAPQGCTGFFPAGIGDYQMVGTADYGGRLLRWEGTPCLEGGLGGVCTVRFTAPGSIAHVTAVYGTTPSNVNFLLQGEGASGTVTVTGAVNEGTDTPFSCRLENGIPGPCSGTFPPGVGVVTVTATPDAGSVFSSWQVGSISPEFPGPPCPTTTPTCTITFSQGNTTLDGIITFSH